MLHSFLYVHLEDISVKLEAEILCVMLFIVMQAEKRFWLPVITNSCFLLTMILRSRLVYKGNVRSNKPLYVQCIDNISKICGSLCPLQ